MKVPVYAPPRPSLVTAGRAIQLVLLVATILGAGIVGREIGRRDHPHTQIAAVCDQRGNTVYTTSSGSVYVLKGCDR